MKRRNYWKEFCLIFIGIFFGMIIDKNIPSNKLINIDVKRDTIVTKDTLYIQSIPLNKENVLAELKRQKLHHPSIVLAQSIHETGGYKSKLCKTHNNLFGIRRNGKYLSYNSWTESITSYKKLIQSKYKNGENYYCFLQRIGYAEDLEYINKIKKYII